MNPRGAASDSRLLLSAPCFDKHFHSDNRRDGDAHTPADRGGATESVIEQGNHQRTKKVRNERGGRLRWRSHFVKPLRS